MYNLTLEIEANTLNEMVNSCVVPAGYEYERLLATNLKQLLSLTKGATVKIMETTLTHKPHTNIWCGVKMFI